MEINRRLVWDYDLSDADLQEEAVKRWYLGRVLTRGTLSDVQAIGLESIRQALPALVLPKKIRSFWDTYFALLDRAA